MFGMYTGIQFLLSLREQVREVILVGIATGSVPEQQRLGVRDYTPTDIGSGSGGSREFPPIPAGGVRPLHRAGIPDRPLPARLLWLVVRGAVRDIRPVPRTRPLLQGPHHRSNELPRPNVGAATGVDIV